jgi:hypothetical protein
MAAAAHVYPNAVQNIATKTENWNNSDTLKVGLVASGTYAWNATSQGHSTVANFLAGDGTNGALTEVSTSSTGYSRQALTSVSVSTSGLVTKLTCATVSWTATSNWSALYAFWYDAAVDTDDTTRKLICYWDFGGTVSVVNGGNFTLTINANGIVTFTAS